MNLFIQNQLNLVVSLNQLLAIDLLKKKFVKGVSLFELRYDLLTKNDLCCIDDWLIQMQNNNLPVLLTIRNQDQGGKFTASENKRQQIFSHYLKHPAIKAIDIELNSPISQKIIAQARHNNKITISSMHFFTHCPNYQKMQDYLNQSNELKADIFKLATHLDNFAAYQSVSQFVCNYATKNNMIVLAMGSFSLLSRVNFPALGCVASYCYLGKKSAPNQPSFAQLQQLKKLCYPSE